MRNLTFGFALGGALIGIVACGPSVSSKPDAGDGDDDASTTPDATPSDAREVPEDATVYAHSSNELFEIDPDTLSQMSVGLFAYDGPAENITDIAVDKSGVMLGISLNSIYLIDRETAHATQLSTFDPGEGGLTSLSFVPIDLSDPGSEEILVAADFDGNVWEIDRDTGERSLLGNYNGAAGSGIGSSGDIVSISGFGTMATVNVEGEATDFLATIDPDTWEATLVGDTGHDAVFGIGFWEGEIYGFTDGMDLVTLDPTTGQVEQTRATTVAWWGAGVTTLAPIIE